MWRANSYHSVHTSHFARLFVRLFTVSAACVVSLTAAQCLSTSPEKAAAAEQKNTNAPGQKIADAKAADGIVVLAGGPAAELRFQQCSHGQRPQMNVCLGDAVSMNHFRAQDYCERLQLGNLRWRLPDRAELERILLKEQPFLPLTDQQLFPRTPSQAFWTRDNFNGANSSFWTVDFRDGQVRGERIFKNAYVRCTSGT